MRCEAPPANRRDVEGEQGRPGMRAHSKKWLDTDESKSVDQKERDSEALAILIYPSELQAISHR
jgi:hypothetical protein